MEVSGQLHCTLGTHWIGGWVGPRADLDAVVKRKIPWPCWKSKLTHPANNLGNMLTELSQLPCGPLYGS